MSKTIPVLVVVSFVLGLLSGEWLSYAKPSGPIYHADFTCVQPQLSGVTWVYGKDCRIREATWTEVPLPPKTVCRIEGDEAIYESVRSDRTDR